MAFYVVSNGYHDSKGAQKETAFGSSYPVDNFGEVILYPRLVVAQIMLI